jgi:hypothetical protein
MATELKACTPNKRPLPNITAAEPNPKACMPNKRPLPNITAAEPNPKACTPNKRPLPNITAAEPNLTGMYAKQATTAEYHSR